MAAPTGAANRMTTNHFLGWANVATAVAMMALIVVDVCLHLWAALPLAVFALVFSSGVAIRIFTRKAGE